MKKLSISTIFQFIIIVLLSGLLVQNFNLAPVEPIIIQACDPGEYQLSVSDEGTCLYDGNRYVGFLPFDSTSNLDKLIIKDNE